MEVLPVWILGVVSNVFLIYILGQYYYSPFIPVSQTHQTSMSTGIKRVVVFIADGLRADTFFDNPQSRPRLEAVMRSGFSASGISISRSPTLSSYSFTAIFAGVYLHYDPSAKLRAIWTRHPDQFDTVFNRTSFTLLLGCVEQPIQDLAKGAGRQKIHAETYVHPENSSTNSTAADTWIRDRFRAILDSKMVPNEGKVLIVFHFLGTDHYGHAKDRENLLKSLALMDEIVAEVEARLSNYFGDNKSMFIFTSDHGMRNSSDERWGQHGGDRTEEVETPFVIWGKGIQKRVTGLRIAQVDMSAFQSSALNIPFPVHTLGFVPTGIWQNKTFAYEALQANFRQFYERMTTRRSLVDLGGIVLRPFPHEGEIKRLLKNSSDAMENQDFGNATARLREAMNLTLNGSKYYQVSSAVIYPSIAAYTFICWIALIAYAVLNFEKKIQLKFFPRATILAEMLLSFFVFRGLLGWSLGHSGCVFFTLHLTILTYTTLRREQASMNHKCLLEIFLTFLLGVEILTTLLYNRNVITNGLILLGFWTIQGKVMSARDKLLWATSLAVLGSFTILPVVGKSKSPIFITLGPLVCGFISLWSLKQFDATKFARDLPRKRERAVLYFQTFLIFSVCFLKHFPEFILTRFVAWTSLALSCTAPFFVAASSVTLRLLSVFLAIATPMSFLSFSYDSLFLPTLFVTLFMLLKIELTDKSRSTDNFWSLNLSYPTSSGSTQLELIHAFRRAWLLVCFSFLCFYGTDSVENMQRMRYMEIANCFVSPLVFPMTNVTAVSPPDYIEVINYTVKTVAAVFRIVGPLILVAVFFRFLLKSRRDAVLHYLIIFLISQPVALYTFLNVRNDWSSNVIGISLAYYIMPQAMTPGFALFQWIGSTLIGAR